jgi:MFS family permease
MPRVYTNRSRVSYTKKDPHSIDAIGVFPASDAAHGVRNRSAFECGRALRLTGFDPRDRLGRWLSLASRGVYFADRRFVIFVLIVFANGVAIGPFLPFLAIFVRDQLGADQSIAGNYRAITAVMMGITGLFAAVASDRLGPKLSLVVGLLSTGVAASVFIVGSEWMLILLAVLHGAGHGLIAIGGETYLVRVAPARQAGAASAAYFLGSTAGSAVGAAAGGALLDATSFAVLGRLMLFASLAITVVAVVWLPRVEPAQVTRVGVLEMLIGYARMLRRGYVRPFIVIELLRSVFWGTAALAMPFVVATLTDSNAAAGYFSGVSLLVGMFAMFVVGSISDRVGRRHIFVALLLAMAFGSAALGLSAGSAVAFIAAGIFATAGAWALSPQIPALVKDIAGPGEAGRLLGLSLFPTAVGILIGAQAHGRFTENYPSAEFLVLAALLLVAVPAAVALFRRGPQA